MNCPEIQQLLSPFVDGELTAEVDASVQSHIEGCPNCAQELAAFQAISALAGSMPVPQPVPGAWAALESRLDATQAVVAMVPSRPKRYRPSRNVVVATAFLILAGIGLSFYLERDEHDNHLAVNFDRYLKEFIHDPGQAQQVLAAAYRHQTVSLEQATQQLRYEPAATRGLPDGYALDAVQVFDMPCCKCIQCIYTNADKSVLTLFEYDSDQPLWFGKRPAVTCRCNGKSTRIVTFDGQLAASWPSGKRHLTLIGARDVKQLMRLMDHFEN